MTKTKFLRQFYVEENGAQQDFIITLQSSNEACQSLSQQYTK